MSGPTGKYRFDTRLGGGGMAEVFIGSTVGAEGFSRKVAIKRILPGFSENPAFAEMFVAEAQISSRLQHPNIVSVLDFDRDPEGRLFLVMELVDGKDLDAINASGLLPFSVVIHVLAEVLRGLGYAHNLPTDTSAMRGIVHRDVSPHNVLVSWEGAVKVSDFGIAKARAASNATASVFIKGKPQYMSPEQANGQPLDGRSDLFAVGVMLWEMLTGQRLFIGQTTQEVLARMLFAPIAWPRQVRADVPVDLERVAMRLLERNLLARYATAEDAIADLLACKDAPRAGRDELIATLTERFPGVAPVRPVRRPSGPAPAYGGATSAHAGGAPMPHPAIGPHASTAPGPGGAALAVAAAPTIAGAPAIGTPASAAMSAETRTVGPRPATRIPAAVWIVAGLVTALLATLIVVVAASSGGATAARDASPAANVPPPAPPDAPTPTATAAAPPDAAPKPDALVARTRDRSDCTFDRSAPKGVLEVLVEPWAVVSVDGKRKSGQTPPTMRLELPAGCHKVRLENQDLDKDVTKKVTIEAGKTETLSLDWK